MADITDLAKEFLPQLKIHWHRLWALIASLVVVVLLLHPVFGSPELSKIGLSQICVTIAFVVVTTGIWFWTNRFPKTKAGSLGFAVAIAYENEGHARQLRADYVSSLRSLVQNWKSEPPIHFMEFPAWATATLIDGPHEIAHSFAERGELGFLIWGRAKLRTLGAPIHVLELSALVAHDAINTESTVHKAFAKEFNELFPRLIQVKVDGDYRGLAITAKTQNLTAKYIIALASGLSGNVDYSICLLRSLKSELINETFADPRLPARVPKQLSAALRSKIAALHFSYVHDRNRDTIKELETIADELALLPTSSEAKYAIRIAKALCHFVLRRDVENARKVLEECKGEEDPVWQWNLAFLAAYQGNLEAAYRLYSKAKNEQVVQKTITEVEEFIQIVLDEEPDKGQLYFILGLINYKFKKDYDSARGDLRKFKAWAGSKKKYEIQVQAADHWIGELKGKRTRKWSAKRTEQ